MRFILLAAVLLLGACDDSPATPPKIAAPQREALEKAKGVEQVLQKENEASQNKINEADGSVK